MILDGSALTDKEKTRFVSYLKLDESTGCLLWCGYRTEYGYGRFRVGGAAGEKESVHRVAWLMSGRTFDPLKPCVLHRCDNPACCNVDHLWLGTTTDNNRDRSRKGRSRRSRRGMPRGVQPTSVNSYQARLQIGSRQVYLGSFRTAELAARVAEAAQRAYDSQGVSEA